MESTIPSFTLPVEDDVLAFTHSKRKIIIDHMLKGGVPEDPALTKVILSALDGMDKAALTRKRIKVEEKQSNNQEQAAALIAKLLVASSDRRPSDNLSIAAFIAPVLGMDIPNPILVVGEAGGGCEQQTYETFIAKISVEE